MMDLETQAQVTEDFVRGLLEHMGLEARVVSSIDEDRALVEAQGLNLGLAIGQRGDTVRAITQLARTMVQRMSDGDAEGSLVVDVGGYRERRRSFLTEFANTQAEEALADGRSPLRLNKNHNMPFHVRTLGLGRYAVDLGPRVVKNLPLCSVPRFQGT